MGTMSSFNAIKCECDVLKMPFQHEKPIINSRLMCWVGAVRCAVRYDVNNAVLPARLLF